MTHTKHYILLGYKVPSNLRNIIRQDEDDKYLPMIEGRSDEKYSILIDDYNIGFGIVLNRLDDDSIGFESIDHIFDISADIQCEIKQKYKELFEDITTDPVLYTLSLYY